MKGKQILGVDPAFRTGCKAVINPFSTFIAKGDLSASTSCQKEAAEKILYKWLKV